MLPKTREIPVDAPVKFSKFVSNIFIIKIGVPCPARSPAISRRDLLRAATGVLAKALALSFDCMLGRSVGRLAISLKKILLIFN